MLAVFIRFYISSANLNEALQVRSTGASAAWSAQMAGNIFDRGRRRMSPVNRYRAETARCHRTGAVPPRAVDCCGLRFARKGDGETSRL